MQFIQHDEPQILKQLLPLHMMRQDSGMKHIRIADHDVPLSADGLASISRRIAIEGKGFRFRSGMT
jgi:hypothetical protein